MVHLHLSPLALIAIALLFTSIVPWHAWLSPFAPILCASGLSSILCRNRPDHRHESPIFPSSESLAWNVHHQLGGVGPWTNNANGTEETLRPPPSCEVEQVHMLSRHTERYPTRKAGSRMLSLLARLQHPQTSLFGELDFARDWMFFTNNPEVDFEQLTRTGPYAGTLTAFAAGVRLRGRYIELLDAHYREMKGKLNVWASDSERVIDTARYFTAGLLGLDWHDQATLHVIPETVARGADTLTPGDSCVAYIDDLERGHDQGYTMLAEFMSASLPAIAARLEALVLDTQTRQSLKLGLTEVYAMFEMCGFEILVRGRSPWCDLFTHVEWEHFAYSRDVLHYYRAGPGTPYSFAMGGLYLNATGDLLLQGPDAGRLFFSFVHDGDIAPVLSALHILHDEEALPTTHVKNDRKWSTSRVMPMGGHILFERLRCLDQRDAGTAASYVRLLINDGIVSIPDCDSGAGLCPLDTFVARVRHYQEQAGDFRTVCGLAEDTPDHITFLKQKNQRFASILL